MDIASLLGPTASATIDPTVASPAVPTVPGEAFSDVLTEAMVEAAPPAPGLPVLEIAGESTKVMPETVVEAPPSPDAILPDCPVAPTQEPRRIGPCKGLEIPKTPPKPPPPNVKHNSFSWKEAAIEVPNAPAQEPDQLEETKEAVVSKAVDANPTAEAAPIPAAPVAVPTNVPAPAAPKFSEEEAPKTGAPVGTTKVAPTPDAAPVIDAQAAAPRPALESAPDLGVVPQVVVASAPEAVAPTVPLVDIAPTETAPLEKAAPVKVEPETKAVSVKPAPDAKADPKVAEPVKAAAVATQKEKPTATEEKTLDPKTNLDAPLAEKGSAQKGDSASDNKPSDDAPKDNLPPEVAPARIQTAATQRPEAGTNRAAVNRHLVVRQVADRIENLVAGRPRDGVTIHLEPRDLGTVTLVVKGLASALDVQMYASDERVRESLDASRPELAQALAPRHIEIRELRVSTAAPAPSASTADSGSNPDGRPRPHTPSQPQPGRGFATSSRTEKVASTSRAARSGRGVDLLV